MEERPDSHGNGIAQPLLIDLGQTYLDVLAADPVAARFPPHLALTDGEARELLQNARTVYSAVILICAEPARTPGEATSPEIALLRLAHASRPSTPVLVVGAGAADGVEQALRGLGARAFFAAGVPYRELALRLNARPSAGPDAGGAGVAGGVEPAYDDYLPVRVDAIVPDVPFRFALYVRISPQRHLKVLHAGDELGAERAASYRARGATRLYINRLDYDAYVLHQERIASGALERREGTVTERIGLLRTQGEATLQLLEKNGVGAASLRYASEFSANTSRLVGQLQADAGGPEGELFRAFLDNLVACEHGVATSLLCGILVETLGIASPGIVETHGLACLLHDLGLQAIRETVDHEHVEAMLPEQRKAYFEHPVIGAHCLASVRGMNEAVPEAIARHHERRGGKGFPQREHRSDRPLIAEVVGVCHELHEILPQLAHWTPDERRVQIGLRIEAAFSSRVVRAVFAAFPTLRADPVKAALAG